MVNEFAAVEQLRTEGRLPIEDKGCAGGRYEFAADEQLRTAARAVGTTMSS